ncbi:hypothetical protein CANMA_004515 [Candida margitis]|uniref:uncharacterized protein n=1 Tax=Candida margitis TaxID=1775924 RepID=UPI00222746D4|nr:uncharacterized protein CANMA_004515 [Candida margitis]KAI5956086.1 hypothetical protein CANMA_004515 [Candida margitis]
MSGIQISTLSSAFGKDSAAPKSRAIQLKLNNDVIHQIRQRGNSNGIKLIVRDGNYVCIRTSGTNTGNRQSTITLSQGVLHQQGQFIKLSEDLEYPCLSQPENHNVDLYALDKSPARLLQSSTSSYHGRVAMKLTVITDSKRIQQLKNTTSTTASASVATSPRINSAYSSPIITPLSSQHSTPVLSSHSASTFNSSNAPPPRQQSITPTPPLTKSQLIYLNIYNPFKVSINYDPQEVVKKKFLNLLALGPITYSTIVKILDYTDFDNLLDDYCQVYNKNDAFTKEDRFPYIDNIQEQDVSKAKRYILKDKSYKELIPLTWDLEEEDKLAIIKNINNALNRLGYSKTHPIRNKISGSSEKNNVNKTEELKSKMTKSSLGGGFLISKNKKKSGTVTGDNITSTTHSPNQSSRSSPAIASPNPQHNKDNEASITTAKSHSRQTSPVKKSSHNDKSGRSPPKKVPLKSGKESIDAKTIAATSVGTTFIPGQKRKLSVSSTTSSSSSSSSSSSNLSDEDTKRRHVIYTSPPSSEEDNALIHYASTKTKTKPKSTPSSSKLNSNVPSPVKEDLSEGTTNETNGVGGDFEYYSKLATKFKAKYQDYIELYDKLKHDHHSTNYKTDLKKLFELHHLLAGWKKQLWDFDARNYS